MTTRSRRSFILSALPAGSRRFSAGRTLVCVFLRGGADTLNMLIPCRDDDYYRLRPSLSISPPSALRESADRCIRLNDFYGIHPQMSPLVPLFEEGRLAWIESVGSDNPTGSHFEAQDQMERGEAFGRSLGSGWLGRYLYTRAGSEPTPLSAVALQPTLPESLRGAPAASAMEALDDLRISAPDAEADRYVKGLASLYEAEGDLLKQAGRTTLGLLERVRTLSSGRYQSEPGVEYPEGNFGSRLREVARLIKAEVGLEVACVDLGGWDTHFFQGSAEGQQARLIGELALGLAAFDADLARVRDRVTTVVMTEFGRRVYENASLGTDHGRGFSMMVLGGKIRGGRVIGEWPGLKQDDPAAGPGGLPIRIDYRSVFAEIVSEILGHPDPQSVFPGFHPQPVGLT